MNKYIIFFLLGFIVVGVRGRAQTHWHGFDRYDFEIDDATLAITPLVAPEGEKDGIGEPAKGRHRGVIVLPKNPAPGNPWTWRGCYWNHQPQAEIELLRRGFCVAYISASATLRPGKEWDAWYEFITNKYNLSKKPAFIGMSRGGEFAYIWATAHPDKVSCIYADNPGMEKGSIMKLAGLAEADVPLLHVCGSLDPILGNNTFFIESFYQRLGGRISLMIKEGAAHHPHSLRDPRPIADFIERSCVDGGSAASGSASASADGIPAASGSGGVTGAKSIRTNYYGTHNDYRYSPEEGAYITYRGPLFSPCYDRYEFNIDGVMGSVVVTVPKKEAPGKPWVFRAGYADHDAVVDLALLAKGYHIVTGPVSFNADSMQLKDWNTTYQFLISHGFSKKPVMEGAGGAAGEVYGWSILNADKVSCIYSENPVLHTTFSPVQPLDRLDVLAKARVPLIDVCGSDDPGLAGNARETEKRYHALGGQISVIVKNGEGHYPLAPQDVGEVVDLITGGMTGSRSAADFRSATGISSASGTGGAAGVGGVSGNGHLLAGTAKVNLTPAGDEPLHDSIYARSLVLELDGRRLAFVSVDLAVFTSERIERICRESYGISEVMISSSHNHSEPQKAGRSFEKTNPYTIFYEDQVIKAVGIAAGNLFPARISAGRRTFPQLGFNRLIIRQDGHARESWFGDEHYTSENPERIPFGPVDPEVGVVRIEDLQGRPRVIMMNYACHADVVCFNYAISADYPGVAARRVEAAFGNTVNCLFVQGAGGNVEPLMISSRRTGPNDPFKTDYTPMERMGELLANETITLAKSLPSHRNDRTDIRFMDDSLQFTGRFDKTIIFNVHFSTLLIDSNIVIAICPGELFASLQLDWKKKIEVAGAEPLLFGYTWSGGRWPGYVADIRSAALGGYGADQGRGLIEPGAGEAIMNRQLENYYRLTGLMRDQPGPTGFKAGNRWIITPVPPTAQ